jgi:hypothetical protein
MKYTTLNAALIVLLCTSFSAYSANGLKISWKERGGYIIHSSVCFNHKYGSLKYRRCKREAKDYFQEQCDILTEKWENTRYPERLKYQQDREKFCHSASTYRIN